MQQPLRLPLVALALVSAGCTSLGPQSIRVERTSYNSAVVETQEEELLLNLVRARYHRSIAFLQVSSISSSLAVEARVEGTAGATDFAGGSFVVGGLSYADRPTVIYQPVTGELFVRQLLAPISIASLALLIDGGFDAKTVFRVFVSEINGVRNADAAVEADVDPADFDRAVELMTALIRRDELNSGLGGPDGQDLFIEFTPKARASEEGRALIRLLRLNPERSRYRLVQSEASGGGDVFAISTRSVAAAINALSRGVAIPEGRRAEVRAAASAAADAARLADLFAVRTTDAPPEGAALSVPYGGHWYSIAATDVQSKRTFGLLGAALRLQAGGEGVNQPVLTLPVSAQ